MPGDPLEMEIYGKRFRVRRERENWVVLIIGQDGKTRVSEDICIPSSMREHEIRRYLEDLLHEYVSQGKEDDQGDPFPD